MYQHTFYFVIGGHFECCEKVGEALNSYHSFIRKWDED